MKLDSNDVAQGKHDGEIVYISHFNAEYNKKPLRNVKPTKVMICSNDEYSTNGKIYYSASHFRTLTKNGTPSSKVIKIFDNTGYRLYTGEPLNIFDNMNESIMSYQEELKAYIEDLEDRKKYAIQQLDRDIDEKTRLIHELEGLRE